MSDLSALSSADLRVLVDTARDLSVEVSLTPLLQSILHRAATLMDATDGAVLLHDPKRDVLFFAHATGAGATAVLERWGERSDEGIPMSGSKAGAVFRTGESPILNSLANDPSHFSRVDRATQTSTEGMICVPLTITSERIGVVQIRNKRGGVFSPRDRVLLECFASQAAVAVRNARLFEDLLAHMGLWSHDGGPGPVELLRELSAPARLETLSILFADMRGFTQLSQLEERPERTQQMLNEFLGMLAAAVIDHRGLVNKFTGDGLMALFRGPDHAACAVRAGAAMVDAFPALRRRWDDLSSASLGFVDVGVGIATDQVILGSVGGDRVRDFTAIGTAVIRAAHLAYDARGGRRVLVDKGTFRGVRPLVEGFAGPEVVELRKPSQSTGHPYDRYEIRQLKGGALLSSAGPALVPAGDAPAARGGARTVFISYSHQDTDWLNLLKEHLAPYARQGHIHDWSDARIVPGSRWQDEIARSLAAAHVAVLLVSPHFLGSEFIATNELPPLLAAARARGLTILWVPISASSYHVTEIGAFQAVHDPTQPLDTLSEAERNRALVALCREIQAALGRA